MHGAGAALPTPLAEGERERVTPTVHNLRGGATLHVCRPTFPFFCFHPRRVCVGACKKRKNILQPLKKVSVCQRGRAEKRQVPCRRQKARSQTGRPLDARCAPRLAHRHSSTRLVFWRIPPRPQIFTPRCVPCPPCYGASLRVTTREPSGARVRVCDGDKERAVRFRGLRTSVSLPLMWGRRCACSPSRPTRIGTAGGWPVTRPPRGGGDHHGPGGGGTSGRHDCGERKSARRLKSDSETPLRLSVPPAPCAPLAGLGARRQPPPDHPAHSPSFPPFNPFPRSHTHTTQPCAPPP